MRPYELFSEETTIKQKRAKTPKPSADPATPSAAQTLRQRAEAQLRKQPANRDPLRGAPAETRRLLHELEVHQIELEVQNEELRRAQEELEESRARYFDLYDLAPVGYLTLSEQGLILEANLTAAKLLGAEKSQLVKKPVTRFIVREDQGIYYLHRQKLFETRARQVWELRMVRKGGIPFWVNLEAIALPGNDDATVCRAALSDITARKRAEETLHVSEERFRIAAQSASDLIWDWDIPGGMLQWFGAIDALLGYAPGEFPRTIEAWEGIIHPDDHDRVMATLDQHLKTRAPYVEEYRVRRKDGTLGYWTDKGEALWDEKGNAYKMIGVCTDITERKQSEKAEQELMRMKDDFVASVSHELRTPLASIKGFLDLLRKGKVQDPIIQQEFLTRAAQDVDRLIPVVNDLLDTSKLEAGRLQLQLEVVDVSALIAEVLQSLAGLAGEKAIATTYTTPKTPLIVKADRRRLRQMLVNLVGNAIKFSEAHRPILITGEMANNLVTIKVIDQGPGISVEGQQRLFDRFYQVGSPSKRTSHGTGLGLYLSKELIEAHGGHIGVESEIGKGSTFFFVLPAHHDADVPD